MASHLSLNLSQGPAQHGHQDSDGQCNRWAAVSARLHPQGSEANRSCPPFPLPLADLIDK
jgi:hypothetical protein